MTTHATRAGRDRPPGRHVPARPTTSREVHRDECPDPVPAGGPRGPPGAAASAEARQARLARSARTDERRLRRALGRSLVRAGQRIAAEATAPERTIEHVTPAGSR